LRQDKRYYFDRDQLVALGIAFVVTSVSIFVLGIITGRHIERNKLAEYAASAAKIRVEPPDAEPDSASEARSGEASAAEDTFTQQAAIPPSDKEPANETETQEQIVRAENTQAMPPVKEAAKSAARQSAAKPADDSPSSPAAKKEPAKEVKAQEKIAKAETALATSPIKDAAKSAPQPFVAKSAEAPPAPRATQEERQRSQSIKKDSLEQAWAVQVQSSPEKNFADRWADRLRTKGYDAFVVEADVKGQTWYRVRVGHFVARSDAEALRITLESKEGLSGAFLTMNKLADSASKR
jgi:DedD protein